MIILLESSGDYTVREDYVMMLSVSSGESTISHLVIILLESSGDYITGVIW